MSSHNERHPPMGSESDKEIRGGSNASSSSSEEMDELSLRVKALLSDTDEETPTISHQRTSSFKQEQPTLFKSIEFETEVILTCEGFSCQQHAAFSKKPEEVPNTHGAKVSGNIEGKDENFSLSRYSDCDTPPLSSVASCKNLDWDNAADIGYIADKQTESTDEPCAKKDFTSDTKRDISEDKTLKEEISLQSNIQSSTASGSTYTLHQDTNQKMRSELSVRPKEKSFLKRKSKLKKKYSLSKQQSSSSVPNISEKSKYAEEKEPLISQSLINRNMYKSAFGMPIVLGNISEDNIIENAAPDEHSIPDENFAPCICQPEDLSKPIIIDSNLLATYEQNTRSSADISNSEDLPYFRWCPLLKSQDIRNASTQTSTKKSNEQGTLLDFHDVSSQNISEDSDSAQHLLIQRNTLNMYSLPLSEYERENVTSYIVPENVKTSDVKFGSGFFVPSEIHHVESRPPFDDDSDVKFGSGFFVPSEIHHVESRPPFDDDSDLVKYSEKSTVNSPPNIFILQNDPPGPALNFASEEYVTHSDMKIQTVRFLDERMINYVQNEMSLQPTEIFEKSTEAHGDKSDPFSAEPKTVHLYNPDQSPQKVSRPFDRDSSQDIASEIVSRSHKQYHSSVNNKKYIGSTSTRTLTQNFNEVMYSSHWDCISETEIKKNSSTETFDERIIQHSSSQMYLPHSMPYTKNMKDSATQTLIEGVDVPLFTYDLSKKEPYLINTSPLSHMYLPSKEKDVKSTLPKIYMSFSKDAELSFVMLKDDPPEERSQSTSTQISSPLKRSGMFSARSQDGVKLRKNVVRSSDERSSSSEENDISDTLPKTSAPFSKDAKLYSAVFKDTPSKGIPPEERSYSYPEEKTFQNVANTKHVRGKADLIHGGQGCYSSDPDINHPGNEVHIKKVDHITTPDRFQDAATNYNDDNREKFMKKLHKLLDDAERKRAYIYHKQLLKELGKKDENVSLHSKNYDIIFSDDQQTIVDSHNSPLHFNPSFMRPLKRSKKKSTRKQAPRPRPMTGKEKEIMEETKKALRLIYREKAKRFSKMLAKSASKGKVHYTRQEQVLKGYSVRI